MGLDEKLFVTPALSLNSSYMCIRKIYDLVNENVSLCFSQYSSYDAKKSEIILENSRDINSLIDAVNTYLSNLSGNLKEEYHLSILTQYYKVVSLLDQMNSYCGNMQGNAEIIEEKQIRFSSEASSDLKNMEEKDATKINYILLLKY